MRRTSFQSKNFIARKRTSTIIWSVIAVVGVAIVIYLASFISSREMFTLTTITLSGLENQDEAALMRADIERSLRGTYLGLFPRAHSFIYPKDEIENTIREQYVDVASVTVARDNLRTLSVVIEEKEPAALVCVTLPDFDGAYFKLTDPGTCYFADETGFIFKHAPSFSGEIYRTYYIPDLAADASTTDTVIGTYATSTEEFVKVQAFYEGVKAHGISVDAIFMKYYGEYELYARNQVATGTDMADAGTVVIYFSTAASSTEQLSNLISFWNHIQTVRPRLLLSDIKLHYPPNVYYTEVQ